MKTPVALFVFNRPDAASRLLETVRRARPQRLLVVADGPRAGRPGERELCLQTREIVGRIDWPCEVLTNFATENLGCKHRLATGLNWVFENVEEAIILEDDCIPRDSFYRYCGELLDRYRSDERVMHVGGNNFGLASPIFGGYSYQFCSLPQVWGWATWRRAWQHFDVEMASWPEFKRAGLVAELPLSGRLRIRQEKRWESVYAGQVDTWDFQWHFAVMRRKGLAIVPSRNLVSNIGFAADATHTTDKLNDRANLATLDLEFPLRHPQEMRPLAALDERFARRMLGDSFANRVWGKIKSTARIITGGAS